MGSIDKFHWITRMKGIRRNDNIELKDVCMVLDQFIIELTSIKTELPATGIVMVYT